MIMRFNATDGTKQLEIMSTEEIQKVKDFASRCIETLETRNYAYVASGYSGDNSGGKFDSTVQRYADKIVSKLVGLGYIYTTNHGYGCRDWSFTKDFEI
jgi:hypothetical protein